MVRSLVDPPGGVPYMLNIQISMGKLTGRSITSRKLDIPHTVAPPITSIEANLTSN